jgi:hypothetical protein
MSGIMDPFVAAALGSMGFACPSNTPNRSTAAAIMVANA